jgi:hypothetical protein
MRRALCLVAVLLVTLVVDLTVAGARRGCFESTSLVCSVPHRLVVAVPAPHQSWPAPQLGPLHSLCLLATTKLPPHPPAARWALPWVPGSLALPRQFKPAWHATAAPLLCNAPQHAALSTLLDMQHKHVSRCGSTCRVTIGCMLWLLGCRWGIHVPSGASGEHFFLCCLLPPV